MHTWKYAYHIQISLWMRPKLRRFEYQEGTFKLVRLLIYNSELFPTNI